MIYGEKALDLFNEQSFIKEQMAFLNEAYIGKTDNLIELERAIGRFRENYDINRDYTGTPEMRAIESCVKRQFNMDYFSMNIIQQNICNAKTYIVGARFDVVQGDKLRQSIIADQKNGYKFKTNNGLAIITAFYAGIFMNKDLTDAEIVAILLHEIGHNFSDIISNDIALANKSYFETWITYAVTTVLIALVTQNYPVAAGLILAYSMSYMNNTNYIHAKAKANEKDRKPGGRNYVFGHIGGMVNDFSLNSRIFIGTIVNGLYYKLLGSKRVEQIKEREPSNYQNVLRSAGRQNEVIADKFAAIYGYGPELSSGLSKMDKFVYPADEVMMKLPYGSILVENRTQLGLDYFKRDVHPSLIQRTNTMISSLEFELSKKNLDPEIRKMIQKQLREMKELKKSYMKITENSDSIEKINNAYNNVIDEKFPDATTDKLEKAINKKIDDLCKSSKNI